MCPGARTPVTLTFTSLKDFATRQSGCLLESALQQAPSVRSVPDHLSVLPISPCHSQRFAQSNTFNCHWNLPTCNEGCKPYLHLGIALSQQIPCIFAL